MKIFTVLWILVSLLNVAPYDAQAAQTKTSADPVNTASTHPSATAVQWKSSTKWFTESTTVEARFPQAMVAETEVGQSMDMQNGVAGPLRLEPALAGYWVWRSQVSGVFIPSHTPAPGEIYRFRLVEGLRDATGQSVSLSGSEYSIRSADLTLTEQHPRWFSQTNTDRQPQLLLQMNRALAVDSLKKSAVFVDREGKRVEAKVRLATYADLTPANTYISGILIEKALAIATPAGTKVDLKPELVLPGTLHVTASEPLPVGHNWMLKLDNLKSAEGNKAMDEPVTVMLGTVPPLQVQSLETYHEVSSPKQLTMHFNKKLRPESTSEEVAKYLQVEPPVEALSVTLNSGAQSVSIGGNFVNDLDYQVILRPGLIAHDGLGLATEARNTARFKMIEPVVALPAFSVSQLAQGRSIFDLQTINMANYKIKVKAADRDTLIYALKAYQQYLEEPPVPEETANAQTDPQSQPVEAISAQTRVPYDLIPGQTIYEKSETVTTGLDALHKSSLDWKTILGDKKAGALFVSIEGEARPEWMGKKRRFGAQAFIQITDIGIAWKWSASEIFIWAFSQESGQPLPQVKLTAFDHEKRTLATAVTDVQGIARLPKQAQTAWLQAETPTDLHAIPLSDGELEGLGLWRFGINYSWHAPKPWERKVAIFTDRPLYQPNDTIYFKACSRWLNAVGKLNKPQKLENATLKLHDAKGRVIHEREITFSEFGTADGSFALNSGSLGYYRMSLTFPELDPKPVKEPNATDEEDEESEDYDEESTRVFETGFLVEEYKPNTFQVKFNDHTFQRQGEKASLGLEARYLLGKALSKASLHWTARVGRADFSPAGMDEFQFLDTRDTYYWDENGRHEVPIDNVMTDLVTAQAKIDLSDQGKANLEFTVPEQPFAHHPREISVEAEVTDINQQTITQRWKKVLPSSDFYLGLSRQEQFTAVDKVVPITLIAASHDGTPHREPVEAKIRVEKISFIETRVETVGGGSNVKIDAQRNLVAEASITVRPQGQVTEPFAWIPKEPGFYYLTATATDAQGRLVESVTSHQVSGSGWATWESEDGIKINLTPDKQKYQAGDTAKILVKSPVMGQALITVESSHVLKTLMVEITHNAQVVEIPLDVTMSPNVFISAFIVRGAEKSPRQHKAVDYKVGYCSLIVEDVSTRLNVSVSTNQPVYRPGDEGTVQVTVTDASGKVVPQAEVTLWAADDGVLTLTDYETPDWWQHFYAPRALSVSTGTTLMNLLPEDPQELAYTNKGYVIGGGGERAALGMMKKRMNFRPLAFWSGVLKTDDKGQASTRFRVPDNLTRFRVMAVALAEFDDFGQGQSHFEINKPLMLEPALPQIAHVGDEIFAKAIVLNHTEHTFDAEVSLTLDSLAQSTGELKKKIKLTAHESVAVTFPLTIHEAGEAQWTWAVTSLTPAVKEADQVVSTLKLDYAQPRLREWHYATYQPGTETNNLLSTVNPELLEGQGQVTLTLSNSVLVEAEGAIQALLQYPYGCAEQTTSSTLPWLVMHQLEETGLTTSLPIARRQAAIQAGAQRLLSMQTSQGGLAYWPGGTQPTLWASCYGGMGLVLCRQAGAIVPTERLDALAKYLSEALRQTSALTAADDLFERAFACYALALMDKGEPAYHDLLRQKIDSLPHAGRALLALAIQRSGGTTEQMIEVLDAPLLPELEKMSHGLFGSRLTGMNLLVWAKIDPHHLITTKLIERLLQERRPDGAWNSTFVNSWSLLALAELAQKQKDNLVEQEITVTQAGQTHKILLPAKPTTQTLKLNYSGQAAKKTLTISGLKSPLRGSLLIEARPKLLPVQPRTVGLGVTRRYQKVSPAGELSDIDELEVGDRVAVTLEVKVPEKMDYLVVDDALPAIFEAMNPKFVTQASSVPAPAVGPRFIPWWSSHTELRKDRALFFADEIWSPGTYQITYLARVIAEGIVIAPPAKVEAMYEPDSYGLSGSQLITAKASTAIVEKK